MATLIKRANIIIVDDNPKNLQLLGTVLKRRGYHVGVARDGRQALKTIPQVLPDLVLLDIMMPGIDGYEVCRQLKESRETAHIPIIFLTARTESEDVVKGFELGAVDYILKPFNMHELLVRVDNHLELEFTRRKLVKQGRELNELLHILCHDLSNPLQALSLYLQMAEEGVESIGSGELRGLTRQCIDIIKLIKTMNRLEEGGSRLECGEVELRGAIEDSLKTMDCYFKQKMLEVECDVEKGIVVYSERRSLVNTVINNLLSNAIKFSYQGGKILVKAVVEGERALLTISDRGVGIPDTLLEKIFTAGRESTRKGTFGESGTGYGMPLVKKFMTAYGGSIELESKGESSTGTTVKLYFKLFR